MCKDMKRPFGRGPTTPILSRLRITMVTNHSTQIRLDDPLSLDGGLFSQRISCQPETFTRWWFQIIYFHPYLNDPIWRAYFSDGLKTPTRFRFRSLKTRNSNLDLYPTFISPTSLFSPQKIKNRTPKAVKFGIGSFTSLFGSQEGRELQAIAKKYHWPLLLGGFGCCCLEEGNIRCAFFCERISKMGWERKGKFIF